MLNFIASHLLAPLFGVPSGLYGLHHVIMHHTVGTLAFTLSDAWSCQDACPKTQWALTNPALWARRTTTNVTCPQLSPTSVIMRSTSCCTPHASALQGILLYSKLHGPEFQATT